MGDLNELDVGIVQRAYYLAHLLLGVLVTNGVRSIAQRRVV